MYLEGVDEVELAGALFEEVAVREGIRTLHQRLLHRRRIDDLHG